MKVNIEFSTPGRPSREELMAKLEEAHDLIGQASQSVAEAQQQMDRRDVILAELTAANAHQARVIAMLSGQIVLHQQQAECAWHKAMANQQTMVDMSGLLESKHEQIAQLQGQIAAQQAQP